MICMEPPDDEDIVCPECGGAAEQTSRDELKCSDCGWSFENVPDIEPEVSFYNEKNLP